jgi:lipopolysaccharide assembly outer membrane protein LptD (OstA)
MNYTFLLISLLSTFLLFTANAQVGAQGRDRIEFSAGSVRPQMRNGTKFHILNSSDSKRVTFKSQGTTVVSDYAEQNTITEDFIGTGRVRVSTAEGAVIRGEKIDYSKTYGKVIITGRTVTLTKDGNKLVTDKIYYDLDTRNAYYSTGGTMTSDDIKLTSEKGYLNNSTNLLGFKGRVLMTDLKKAQTLRTDSLTYQTDQKIARFYKMGTVESADGRIESSSGAFYELEDKAVFEGFVKAETDKYVLTSKKLTDNNKTGFTTATGDVSFLSKEDKVILTSDEMIYRDSTEEVIAYGKALMQRPLADNKQMYLAADTLKNIEDAEKGDLMLAYSNVSLINDDVAGVCDSLVYHYSDSLIYLYQDPYLFSEGSQLSGETILARMAEGELHELVLQEDGFIVEQDTLGNFNQIKGKTVTASFENNELQQVLVDGNAQLIYYLLEEDNTLTGVNKSSSSKLLVYFDKGNKLKNIDFLGDNTGGIVPLEELAEPDKFLPGFENNFERRPTAYFMMLRKARRK